MNSQPSLIGPILGGFVGALLALFFRVVYEEIVRPWLIRRRFSAAEAMVFSTFRRGDEVPIRWTLRNKGWHSIRRCRAYLSSSSASGFSPVFACRWAGGEVEADISAGEAKELELVEITIPNPSAYPVAADGHCGIVQSPVNKKGFWVKPGESHPVELIVVSESMLPFKKQLQFSVDQSGVKFRA